MPKSKSGKSSSGKRSKAGSKRSSSSKSNASIKAAVASAVRSAVRPKANYGTRFGRKLGGYVGGMAQKWIGNITGLGDYAPHGFDVKKNILGTSAAVPYVNKIGQGVRITHREYLGDIVTSSTQGQFKLSSYKIQPSSSVTFPWLH